MRGKWQIWTQMVVIIVWVGATHEWQTITAFLAWFKIPHLVSDNFLHITPEQPHRRCYLSVITQTLFLSSLNIKWAATSWWKGSIGDYTLWWVDKSGLRYLHALQPQPNVWGCPVRSHHSSLEDWAIDLGYHILQVLGPSFDYRCLPHRTTWLLNTGTY